MAVLGRNPKEGKHWEALGTKEALDALGRTRKHLEALEITKKH